MMNFRLARPSALVDVMRIPDLAYLRRDPDEMVVEVCFPRPAPNAALTEFAQRRGDFAVVAAAVALELADGACRSARVVLGGVGPLPVMVESVEEAVMGRPPIEATWREVGELAARQID